MKIHLDHAIEPNAAPPWTLGLLMVAVLLVSVISGEYVKLEDERTDLQSQMLDDVGTSHQVQYSRPLSPDAQKALREQAAQANAVLSELGRCLRRSRSLKLHC